MPRVSESHRTERREQILGAALRCVAREGFHKTTMAHVITESGLSAGAVYGYFRGKPELIHAIAERAVGSLAAALVEVAEGPGPVTPAAALGHVLERIDDLARDVDGAFPNVAVHAWSEAARDPQVRTIVATNIASVRTAWRRVLDRAVSDGTVPPLGADLDGVAAVLMSLMPGYVLQGTLLGQVDRGAYLAGFDALLRTSGAGAESPPRR